MKVLLLAHDLSDPAISRRVEMLQAGGADVLLAGFRRTEQPIDQVAKVKAVDFGQTFNAGFIRRIAAVLKQVVTIKRHQDLFSGADVVIARNLEMLSIAVRGRSLCRPKPVLVYECLDIHRLMLKEGIVGYLLRELEGWLARSASALITSSPAFVTHYFERRSRVKLPAKLIENKVLALDGISVSQPVVRKPGPPWVIGWFGVIRCKQSFQLLSDLLKESNGDIEVVIRGRPAKDLFPDFEQQISSIKGMSFLGPYKNPGELPAIYGSVHFSWAIDMFEQGLNSSWLLPNRAYEGGLYGAVPLAIASVETGRFFKRLEIGVLLDEPIRRSLVKFFSSLKNERYSQLESQVLRLSSSTWTYDKDDCKNFVNYLSELRRPRF